MVAIVHKDMDQTVPLEVNLIPVDVAPEVSFDPTALVWRLVPNDTIAGTSALLAEQWIDNQGYINGNYTVETLQVNTCRR
jgi:hypothetical protein